MMVYLKEWQLEKENKHTKTMHTVGSPYQNLVYSTNEYR